MKNILLQSIAISLIFASFTAFGTNSAVSTTPTQYFLFFDDFNDGDAAGWWLGYSHANHSVYGNWRVENGVLAQDVGGDGFIALVKNYQFSNQIVSTMFKFNGPAGYGGFVLWFQDYNNLVFVRVYPGAGGIWMEEWINGAGQSTPYPYSINYNDNAWHTLKVEANSGNGDLRVYIDDVYIFTHHTITPQRIGQSGLMNGNGGGYFDNFMVYSGDSAPVKCYLPLVHR